MNIFISYTTRDAFINIDLLKNIENEYSRLGNIYIDLLHNRATNKQHHVEKMLLQADSLLLIDSKSINKSKWVQWELTKAKNHFIPIITAKATSDKNETLHNIKLALTKNFSTLKYYNRKSANTII